MSKGSTTIALVVALILLAGGRALAGPEDLSSALSDWPGYEPSVERTRITSEAAGPSEYVEPGAPIVHPLPRPDEKGSDWKVFIAVYGWLAGVDGRIVDGGETTDLDVPFRDLASATRGGFQGYAELRYREWFLAFDGTWAELGGEKKGRLLDLDITIDQRLFDLRFGWNVLRNRLGAPAPEDHPAWQRELVIDLFLGARYWETKIGIETTLKGQRPNTVTTRDDRWDPSSASGWGGTSRSGGRPASGPTSAASASETPQNSPGTRRPPSGTGCRAPSPSLWVTGSSAPTR